MKNETTMVVTDLKKIAGKDIFHLPSRRVHSLNTPDLFYFGKWYLNIEKKSVL